MEIQPEVQGAPTPQAAQAAAPAKPPIARPAACALLCLYILAVLTAGILLRNWTWRATTAIHFPDDIRNGLFWGEQTVLEGRRLNPGASGDTLPAFFEGYVSIYDYSNVPGRVYDLDYAPLRLLIMSAWARYSGMPPRDEPLRIFASAAPLLLLNTLCELASAIAIFLLVRTWLRLCAATARPGWFRKLFPRDYILICSLAAATVAWLEPTMILDTHAWPQWDVWIMPFYLFAALAMMNGRMLISGILIAIGAMMKPQILIVAPFFLLVPLFAGQWRRIFHFLAGFGIAAGLIAFPWLVRGTVAWGCIIEAALISAGICVVRRKVQLEGGAWLGIRNIKQSETPFWCCLVFAIAILSAGWFCGGDFTWYQDAFQRSAKTSPSLAEPAVWANLPSLLDKRGWKLDDPFAHIDIAGSQFTLPLRLALRLAYLAALALCAFGAARHLRRRDPRFLITIALPWLLMFALVGQMHSRYLLWGAVASSLALGVSWRLGLLHFVFSAAGAGMILTRLADNRPSAQMQPLLDLINRFKPHAPHIILASVAIWLWFSLWRSRRPSPPPAAISG